MKQKVKKNVSENSNITVFRYKMEDLEKRLIGEHEAIKKDVAIPLGKDLGNMQPSKPEVDCENDVYTGVISGAYSKMMMTVKKELQSEIESHHIVADKQEADQKLQELETELEKKQTDYRIKKRELEKCDNTLKKKAERYKWKRLMLMFMILLDTIISGSALQAMNYPLIFAYMLGFGIGVGIFILAENFPNIINWGKTIWQKRLIAVLLALGLLTVFYYLGTMRASTLGGNSVFGSAAGPWVFACLNLFLTFIAIAVVFVAGLTKEEKKIWDKYRITEEEADVLKKEVDTLKEQIIEVRKTVKESELARTQIQIYAHDMQELVQRLYEESIKTFYSTNLIHRSDGKIPKFFERDIPMLPSFYKGLSI